MSFHGGYMEQVWGLYRGFLLRDDLSLRRDSLLTSLNDVGTVKDHSTIAIFEVSLDAF